MSATAINTEFLLSVHTKEQLEKMRLPEVAFIGRSNSGKSSLINALCNQKALAISSKMPGRTQALNFFKLELKSDDERLTCHFVDLPGYGFSKAGKAKEKFWQNLIEPYLHEHPSLRVVVLLVDIRRGLQDEELFFIEQEFSWKLFVAFTKTDKLSKSEIAGAKREHAKGIPYEDIQTFYTSASKKQGTEDLLQALLSELSVA